MNSWISTFLSRSVSPRYQSCFAGLLMGLAFPPLGQFYLVPVALIVLFRALADADAREQVYSTAGFGFFFFLIHTYWFVNFHPLAFPGVLIVVSLLYGAWGYSLRWTGLSPWSLAGGWIFLQSVLGAGPLAFPWSRLPTALAVLPELVQPVHFVGELVYGGVIVLVCAALAFPRRSSLRRAQTIGVLVLAVLLAAGIVRFSTVELRTSGVRTLLVQPGVLSTFGGQDTAGELRQSLLDLTREHAREGELVVWPETVLTEYPFRFGWNRSLTYRKPEARETYRPVIPPEAHLLAGLPIYDPKENQPDHLNAAVVMNSQADPVGLYTKKYMVPFGEYIPGMGRWALVDRLARAVGTLGYRSGTRTDPVAVTVNEREYELGVQICYEDAFPAYVRDQVLKGADLLVNVSNDSWSRSEAAHWQHFYRARLRAIETGRTLLRNGNTGVSAVISPLGTVRDHLEPFEKGVLRGEIFEPVGMSPIVTYQSGLAAGMVVLLLTVGWIRREDLS